MKIIDLTNIHDSGPPDIVSQLPLDGAPAELDVVDGRLYLANRNSSVDVIDVSDSTRPRFLERLDLPQAAVGVKVVGDHLYVTTEAADVLRSRSIQIMLR